MRDPIMAWGVCLGCVSFGDSSFDLKFVPKSLEEDSRTPFEAMFLEAPDVPLLA